MYAGWPAQFQRRSWISKVMPKPEHIKRPHYPEPPAKWQSACGAIVLSWAPIEFEVTRMLLNLRTRRKHPPSPTDMYAYSDFPLSFKKRTTELKTTVKLVPELAHFSKPCVELVARAKTFVPLRHWAAHGHFVEVQSDSQKFLMRMDGSNTRFAYKERAFSISELANAAPKIRALSEDFAELALDMWYTDREKA